ncbi:hypothetical protein MtrunA17_Chr1g0201681 [Medicago truncatula]|uniref:Transmembrane protein n=1 Tax=Medicago truncatula TaxID=3880 RepID=A0A396JVU0_MEDTR|nr:hypothetical protein MtrunA17_Chr1g0201681 [Medicago truncatula]
MQLHRKLLLQLLQFQMFQAILLLLCVDLEFLLPIFPMVSVLLLCIFFFSPRFLLRLLSMLLHLIVLYCLYLKLLLLLLFFQIK